MRQTKNRMVRGILAAALAVGTCLAIFSGCSGNGTGSTIELQEPIRVRPEGIVIRRQDIMDMELSAGCILPRSEEISLPAGGTVGRVEVYIGQTVKKGDVLFQLNTEREEKQLENLEKELELMQKDFRCGRNTLESAAQSVQSQLDSLRASGGDSVEITLKEIDSWQAWQKVRQYEENMQAAQQRVQKKIDDLREKIREQATAVAPMDGTVTWIRDGLVNGAGTVRDEVLMRVSSRQSFCVICDRISEDVLDKHQQLYAVIGDEKYELIPQENSVEEDTAAMVNDIKLKSRFEIVQTSDSAPIPSDGNALVICAWNCRQNVISVPKGAVFYETGEQYVYVIEEGVMKKTPVEIGLSTATHSEILTGLEEGDVVYVED